MSSPRTRDRAARLRPSSKRAARRNKSWSARSLVALGTLAAQGIDPVTFAAPQRSATTLHYLRRGTEFLTGGKNGAAYRDANGGT